MYIDAHYLPYLHKNDWILRWVYLGNYGTVLHRVTTEIKNGQAKILCSANNTEFIVVEPGFFGRTSAPRCIRCCKALGIPQGIGAPYNHNISEFPSSDL